MVNAPRGTSLSGERVGHSQATCASVRTFTLRSKFRPWNNSASRPPSRGPAGSAGGGGGGAAACPFPPSGFKSAGASGSGLGGSAATTGGGLGGSALRFGLSCTRSGGLAPRRTVKPCAEVQKSGPLTSTK
jgi:hypothetical protein